MIRKALVIVGLYLIITQSVAASRVFAVLDGSQRFWMTTMIMAGCGLWLGIFSPGTASKVISPKQFGFWIPAVGLGTIMFQSQEFNVGTALALAGLFFFWLFAKGTMKFLFGIEYSKRMHSGHE